TREIREKVVRDLAEPVRRRHFLEVLDTSLASIDENDLSRDLKRIRQPALIVWGASDLLLPLDHALRLRCGLPRSRLVVYPGVGHVPSVEVPRRFNRTLLRFLTRYESLEARH
ncbi:MAG: hypothetical protein HY720_16765, partial [Planctomycetes bacterium]|nr:hypothetical protein [Planctomycetota bacterium]